MKEKHFYTIRHLLILLAFLPALVFPLFNQWVPLVKKRLINQAKLEKPLPVFDINRLDKFPKQFDEYFDDRLKVRDKLVLINSVYKIGILHESMFPDKVIIGKDGWLFLPGTVLKYYQRTDPFSLQQLTLIRSAIKERAKWLNDRGIKFYVAIAPNKHEIYNEYLPSGIRRASLPGRVDQFKELLKNDTEIPIIDLREVLTRNKRPLRLYYKTDNHWNAAGGFYAYTQIISTLNKDFPSLGMPRKLDDFTIDSSEVSAGGQAMNIGMEEWYFENMIKLIPKFKEKGIDGKKMNYPPPAGFAYAKDYEVVKEVKNDTLPKVVFIRDSYADYVIPFLKEHFRKSVYIFDAWQYGQNRNIIENEKPDIVVLFLIDNAIEALPQTVVGP